MEGAHHVAICDHVSRVPLLQHSMHVKQRLDPHHTASVNLPALWYGDCSLQNYEKIDFYCFLNQLVWDMLLW